MDHLEPARGPLDVGVPGLGDPPLEAVATPVAHALADTVGREEERRPGPRERLGELGHLVVVGGSYHRRVRELAAVVAVHRLAHARVTGDVDVDRGPLGQRGDVLVVHDAVIHAQPARELGAAR